LDGNLSLEYTIPDDWAYSDYLNVRIVCPSGEQAAFGTGFPPFAKEPGFALDLEAESLLRSGVLVTALNARPGDAGFENGWVWLVPELERDAALAGAWGGTLGCAVSDPVDQERMECIITVPDGLPEGPYVVVGEVSSVGSASNLTREAGAENATMFTWERLELPSPGGPDTVPGFESGALIVAFVALVGLSRRRRSR
jgi:hypothetical protein